MRNIIHIFEKYVPQFHFVCDFNFLRKYFLTILSRNPNMTNRNSKNHGGRFNRSGHLYTRTHQILRNFASR